MHYLGGKHFLSKTLGGMITKALNGRVYWEPFVGAGNVVAKVESLNTRFASDVHEPLIAMWLELQKGWIPPQVVSESEYKAAKEGVYPDYLTAFIGFACSFGGKYFGGYARSKDQYNYTKGSSNSLLKKLETCKNVKFFSADYRSVTPVEESFIYCDPPYIKTTGYKGVPRFSHEEFWETVRGWSREYGCEVWVSEENAPKDFEVIWEKSYKSRLRDSNNQVVDRYERLFRHKE